MVRNPEPSVIERGPKPARRCMACCARRREADGGVVWIRGGVVVCFVTAVAVGRQRGVVVVHVAVGAGNRGVESRKGKCCRVVIKLAVGPQCRVVAQLTSRRETHLKVINRSRCRVVVLQVTRRASRTSQVVVVVDMAVRANARRDHM